MNMSFLDEIVDHRCTDSAIKLADQKVVRANGKTYLRRSTIGWQLCCQWKDDSTSWTDLADLKESHPVEVAEYAKIIGIDHEPAFNWWLGLKSLQIHRTGSKELSNALDRQIT